MKSLAHPRYFYKSFTTSDRISSLMQSLDPSLSSYSGRLSPSGRLTIGYRPSNRQRVDDIRYEASRGRWVYSLRCHWHYLQGLQTEVVAREEKGETLGLSIVSNCRNGDARRYGLRGMTSNGRNKVYDGAYLLQRAYPKRLGFYTLTCPYTDVESIYLYNQNINYIVRSYFEELKRVYDRLKIPFSYVSVLEYQDARYDESGIPVLHIHYVAPCYLPHEWAFVLTADEIRVLWGRVLARVLGSGVPLGSSVDAQVVKTSAANYLAKYLSKGGRTVQYLASTCPDQVPRQWWSMSRNVRESIKNSTVIVHSSICERLLYGSDAAVDSGIQFVYSQKVYANIHGQDRLVGMYAQLTKRSINDWISFDLSEIFTISV